MQGGPFKIDADYESILKPSGWTKPPGGMF
jgi:hypothetical protein